MENNQFGTRDHDAAAATAATAAANPQPQASMLSALAGTTNYTSRDVLNGRGQGVQRHPGNVNYRTLVSVNKVLYAQCPRSDKAKISKGIVAAMRQHGSRFLELEERTGIYHDIGDKKATEKTSQALREGQTKIRQRTYQEEKAASLPQPAVSGHAISAEGYQLYSSQVLESLLRNNPPQPMFGNGGNAAALDQVGEQFLRGVTAPPPPPRPAPMSHPGHPPLNSRAQQANMDALARVREQFPGASEYPPLDRRPQQANMDALARLREQFPGASDNSPLDCRAQQANMDALARVREQFPGAMHHSSSARLLPQAAPSAMLPSQAALPAQKRSTELTRMSELMNMSIGSMSLAQLLEARDGDWDRAMRDAVRLSAVHWEDLDRVSDLRSTNATMNPGRCPPAAPAFQDPRNSLMDASIMSIGTDDMSPRSSLGDNRRQSISTSLSSERETAESLMRLSADTTHSNHR